jgi:hypothetical protein
VKCNEAESVNTRDIVDNMLCNLDYLNTTIDTICSGLEQEKMEPQVFACLKCIQNSVNYIRQTAVSALKTKTETQ